MLAPANKVIAQLRQTKLITRSLTATRKLVRIRMHEVASWQILLKDVY